jgi:hypothetical protein
MVVVGADSVWPAPSISLTCGEWMAALGGDSARDSSLGLAESHASCPDALI